MMKILCAGSMKWFETNFSTTFNVLRCGPVQTYSILSYKDIPDTSYVYCPNCFRFSSIGGVCSCGHVRITRNVNDLIFHRKFFPTISTLCQLGYKNIGYDTWKKGNLEALTNSYGIVYTMRTLDERHIWVENGQLYYWTRGIYVPEKLFINWYTPIEKQARREIFRLFTASEGGETDGSVISNLTEMGAS